MRSGKWPEPATNFVRIRAGFVSLWENREKLFFKNERLLQGFLYSVTRNRAVDAVRNDQKDRQLMKILARFQESEETENQMDKERFMAEAVALIHEKIEQLTPKYRDVLVMHIAGRKTEKIADAMQISASTVRSNLARAIENVRKALDERGIFLLTVILTGEKSVALIEHGSLHLN